MRRAPAAALFAIRRVRTTSAASELTRLSISLALGSGCMSSAISRKQIVPVVERHGGLLFYPSQYEGEEQSANVFYTGATPNQQALPAIDYLMSPQGGGFRRFALIGTDYVYPQVTNRILQAYLAEQGIAAGTIVHLLADPMLGELYSAAIEAAGGNAVLLDSHDAFVAGITRLWRLIR